MFVFVKDAGTAVFLADASQRSERALGQKFRSEERRATDSG